MVALGGIRAGSARRWPQRHRGGEVVTVRNVPKIAAGARDADFIVRLTIPGICRSSLYRALGFNVTAPLR